MSVPYLWDLENALKRQGGPADITALEAEEEHNNNDLEHTKSHADSI